MNEFEEGFMTGFLLNRKSSVEPTPEPEPEPILPNWKYPSNWLKLPTPKDNQIVLLLESQGYYPYYHDADGVAHNDGLLHASYYAQLNLKHDSISASDGLTYIDWGDGSTSETFNISHGYERGSGTDVGGGVEQFIVTINFNSDLDDGTEYFMGVNTGRNTYYIGMNVLAIRVGNCKYLYSNVALSGGNVQYIDLLTGDFKTAFKSPYQLRKVDLHSGITSLPSYAFENAYYLTDIDLTNITTLGKRALYYCLLLDFEKHPLPNLESIGEYAFAGTGLKNINFEKITSIGAYAFSYCKSLTTIENENVTSIGKYTFSYCDNLTSISFKNATSVGQYAFANCNRLITVKLPNVSSIESYAFQNCYALRNCILPSDFEITNNAFSGCVNVNFGTEEK